MDIEKILNRTLSDDRQFGIIYSIDPGDDWTSEASLRKANPNYDISVSGEFLRGQVKRAMDSPTKQNITKTKHLNVWVGAREAWLNLESWDRCADTSLKREDFVDVPCVIGIDLATRVDLAAISQVFQRKEADGRTHYYAFTDSFVPEKALEISKNAHRFNNWANQGFLTVHNDAEIDLVAIQAYLIGEDGGRSKGLAFEYDCKEVAYDPWQASQLAQCLGDAGATVLEFRHTVGNMSPAMKELEGAINSGRFHFDGNPVLSWCASNTTAKADRKDNYYPNKQTDDNKIDCMIALLMAIGRSMAQVDNTSKYESQPMVLL